MIFIANLTSSEPSAPPQNIAITSPSSTSLHVTWDSVPPIHQNGIITHYDVEYNQSTFSQVSSSLSQTVSGDIPAVMLNGLEEYVIYSVRVKAYTSIGEGPYSSPENERTLEDGILDKINREYIFEFISVGIYIFTYSSIRLPSKYGSYTIFTNCG